MSEELILVGEVGEERTVVLVAVGAEDRLEERPVGAASVDIDAAIASLGAVVRQAAKGLDDLGWHAMTIELGVKFGVKSGKLLAVIGSVEASSSMTVKLEFAKPTPAK